MTHAISYAHIKEMADRVRNIPLNDVMALTGSIRDKYDKHKWHSSQGTISITCQKFMNWSLQTGGGGAIDLVIHLNRLDFQSAVIWLVDRFPACCPVVLSCAQSTGTSTFYPPEKHNHNLPAVIHYLRHHRNIPMGLIKQLVLSGKLYADIRSNAVFLLLGKNKQVVGAELRGTSHKRWVGMAMNSDKNQGAFFVKATAANHIIVCESAIDAISYFAMHPHCLAISASGSSPSPKWLHNLVNSELEIFCGFDDDETGNRNADKMIRFFPKIKRLKPLKHDWNDVLKSALNLT